MNAVDQLDALLNAERQPGNPLRPHQVKAYREEAQRLNDIVHAPAWVEGDRAQATKRFRGLNQMLAEQAPRKSEQGNEIRRLADEVLATHIRPTMQPREIMRRNPTGAVGVFIQQEQAPATKRAIRQWKRAQWALDPDTDDPDHTNLERHRPELARPDGTSTYMADAQIPGVFAMSPQAKANWPAELPPQGTVNSAIAQVKRREKKIAKPEKAARPPMSAAARENLRTKALARLAALKAQQATERLGG